MENLHYHTFKKPKVVDGKTVHRWYYYFYDESGRKVQKSCGKNIRSRNEAENFIRTLPSLAGSKNQDLLVSDVAGKMYLPASEHINRRLQLGKSTELETMAESRRYVEKILADWGNQTLRSIEAQEVENLLFRLKKSGSWKNRYIAVFKEIFFEAARCGCKLAVPDFLAFARNVKKADTFTTDELSAFFRPDNFSGEPFFVFFLLMLSAGLRLGEARAVRYKQVIFDKKILVIDGFCKTDGTRTAYNKKGTQEKPKFRAVWLPDYTIKKLLEYLGDRVMEPEDYFFSIEGRPVRKEHAEANFAKALIKAGIAHSREKLKLSGAMNNKGKIVRKQDLMPDGRKLVPHSLRYTYVSRMRRELSAAELQPMTGHASLGMVDYYNRKDLEQVLQSLPDAASALDGLLDFRRED